MKKIFLSTIMIVSVTLVMAQDSFTAMQYSMGFGSGSLGDYIEPASFRGFTIDYRKIVKPNTGVGFDVGWNVFYDEVEAKEYTSGNLTYYGKQYRYSNCVPLLGAIDYFKSMNDMVTLYGGLGVGTMYSERYTEMGVYAFTQDAWQFALRPEIGLLIDDGSGVGITLLGKYYYGFEASDLDSQGYFALNIGLVWYQ